MIKKKRKKNENIKSYFTKRSLNKIIRKRKLKDKEKKILKY